ncbi:MAG: hypothetical protein HGB03_01830 [Candidatus Yonathbacteria bacterium]|nr:hypothetical protein [Candidatus Yonathbacteria bacterium]NTW47999.1 hypothetical protein [Candidatus Yonathbacteria bacterium]
MKTIIVFDENPNPVDRLCYLVRNKGLPFCVIRESAWDDIPHEDALNMCVLILMGTGSFHKNHPVISLFDILRREKNYTGQAILYTPPCSKSKFTKVFKGKNIPPNIILAEVMEEYVLSILHDSLYIDTT